MTDDRIPDPADGPPEGSSVTPEGGTPEGAAGNTGGPTTPPPPGGPGAPPPVSPNGGSSNRTMWIGLGVVLLIAVVALIAALANQSDDDEVDIAIQDTTTEAPEDTTTEAPEETTTTAAEETTTTAAETTTTVAETTTTAGLGGTCAIENLALLQPGVLTVATGEPAFPPWVGLTDGTNFDVPESQTGFESALVYELAGVLGFADDQVTWVRTGFDEAIAPGPKNFDFNLQQFSITPQREEAVDFSDPYYETKQSLVALAGSPFIGSTALADLADARLGAQIGTTSFDFIENVIQPNVEASVYDTNILAISALVAGQIDGIVVDLPTAYFITAVQIPEQEAEGAIVAQFGTPAENPDQYGLVFVPDNTLVDCANQALTVLRDGGTLQSLEDTWLAAGGDIPTITE